MQILILSRYTLQNRHPDKENCVKCMTKVSVVVLLESIHCLRDSLRVNSVDSCQTEQRAVLEGVRGEGVISCIPQTAAADLHALPGALTDVDQDDGLISGNHEVLHTGSYDLGGAIQRIKLTEQKITLHLNEHAFQIHLPHILFLSFFETTPLHISPLGGNW